MVAPTDLIVFPYSPDMTRAGITFACRLLMQASSFGNGPTADRLRRIVTGAAAELAFRRCLGEQEVPYNLVNSSPFTDPERVDVTLGGRRCEITTFHIHNKIKISQVNGRPEVLLKYPALAPLDKLVSERMRNEDIIIFAFTTGLITKSTADLENIKAAGLPDYLIHLLPKDWRNPSVWRPLEQITLKTESIFPATISLNGRAEDRSSLHEKVHLLPLMRSAVNGRFYTLAYLDTPDHFQARLGIYSPVIGEAHLINPNDWVNLWVYGMQVFLAGYMTFGEFRRRAAVLPVGSRTSFYQSISEKSLCLPVAALHPLPVLFSRVKNSYCR
jgi:hypothetical protein